MYNSQHPIDDEIFGGNQQLKDFAHYCLNNRPITDIRKYVALHNKELLNIGSRVLNQLIPLNGYRFLKVNGKITVSKSKGNNSSLSNSVPPSISEPISESINESTYDLRPEFESDETTFGDSMIEWKDSGFTECSDTGNDLTDDIKPPPKKSEITAIPFKSEATEPMLSNKQTLVISKPFDGVVNEQTMMEAVKDEPEPKAKEPETGGNTDLMKHLNNLYIKELGEQEKKYNDMMTEIKQSIAVKEKVETEKNKRVNSVLDAVEETYSSQSLAKIIKYIQLMTDSFITQRNEEVNILKQTIASMNSEIQYLKGQFTTFPQIVNAIVEDSSKSMISEVNHIVDEKIEDINVEIKELDESLKQLTLEDNPDSKYADVTKDQIIENIDKIANVVYSLAPQAFK